MEQEKLFPEAEVSTRDYESSVAVHE